MRKMDAAEWLVSAVVAVIAVQVMAWMIGPWIDWLVRK